MSMTRFVWNLVDRKIEYRKEADKHKIEQI